MTNSDLARLISRINTETANAMASLADGMWNPRFCAADASDDLSATRMMERIAPLITSLTRACPRGHAGSEYIANQLTEAASNLVGNGQDLGSSRDIVEEG